MPAALLPAEVLFGENRVWSWTRFKSRYARVTRKTLDDRLVVFGKLTLDQGGQDECNLNARPLYIRFKRHGIVVVVLRLLSFADRVT